MANIYEFSEYLRSIHSFFCWIWSPPTTHASWNKKMNYCRHTWTVCVCVFIYWKQRENIRTIREPKDHIMLFVLCVYLRLRRWFIVIRTHYCHKKTLWEWNLLHNNISMWVDGCEWRPYAYFFQHWMMMLMAIIIFLGRKGCGNRNSSSMKQRSFVFHSLINVMGKYIKILEQERNQSVDYICICVCVDIHKKKGHWKKWKSDGWMNEWMWVSATYIVNDFESRIPNLKHTIVQNLIKRYLWLECQCFFLTLTDWLL